MVINKDSLFGLDNREEVEVWVFHCGEIITGRVLYIGINVFRVNSIFVAYRQVEAYYPELGLFVILEQAYSPS